MNWYKAPLKYRYKYLPDACGKVLLYGQVRVAHGALGIAIADKSPLGIEGELATCADRRAVLPTSQMEDSWRSSVIWDYAPLFDGE